MNDYIKFTISISIFFLIIKYIFKNNEKNNIKKHKTTSNSKNRKSKQEKIYRTENNYKETEKLKEILEKINIEQKKKEEEQKKKEKEKEKRKYEDVKFKKVYEDKTTNEKNEEINDKTINLYSQLYNERKTKQQIFEENRKKRYKQHLKDIAIKGKNYELFIGKHYEERGYKIEYNGIKKGRKDDGIDLIAKKEKEAIFIQCKNWKENSKRKIEQKDIKSFVGSVYTYTEKNIGYKNYKIKRLFICSNDIFDYGAKCYCRENRNIIEYKIIKEKTT